MAQLSALDRAIATISPSWGLKRALSRARFEHLSLAFDAAEKSGTTADWKSRKSTLEEIVSDSGTVIARARDACRNDWAAASIVGAYQRHIVGTGITARSAARLENGDSDEAFNERLDNLWSEWASSATMVDFEKRKNLVQFQSMIVSEIVKAGHCIVLERIDRRARRNPLRYQIMPPERLCEHLYKNPANGNCILGGVEINDAGITVAFWFHNGEDWSKPVRIGAEHVLHIFEQSEPGEPFAASWLAPVLAKMRHLNRYDQYQLIRARFEAAIGAVIEDKGGDEDDGDFFAGPSTEEISKRSGSSADEFVIEPGMSWQLPKGKTAKFHMPTAPGGLYDPFVRAQVRQIAAGAGLDYSQVMRDFTGGNFSSQRQALLEVWKQTEPKQLMLVDRFLRPVRERFIAIEILSGRLEAPDFFSDEEDRRRKQRTDWRPPPRPWISPRDQAQAAVVALTHGISNLEAEHNTLGQDWREEMRQMADEKNFAESLGLKLPQFSGGAAASGAGGEPAAPDDDDEEPVDPDETEGGDGADDDADD